jgi:cAMP-dependent protein kinase regulator
MKDQIVNIVGQCVVQLYPSNTVLFKQHEPTSSLWIIKSGRIKIMKTVKFSYLEGTRVYDMHNLEGPSAEDLETGNYGEKVIQIDEYGKNDIFGVESLLNDENFAFTGVTSIPTELVIINFEDVNKLMTPELKT